MLTWLWNILTFVALGLAAFVAWFAWGDREYGGLKPLWWVPALILVAVGFSFGNGPLVEAFSPLPDKKVVAIATTTTELPATTSTRPLPVFVDPSIGRPVYTEFSLLMLYDDQLRSTCAESYGNDTPACYDAYARGTDDFEATIKGALEARLQEAVGDSRGYASNQYGCHDDGRCLDDYDEWCSEAEVSYVEGFGLACPGTLQSINDQIAEDFYQDQMEQERYSDP